MSKQTLVVKPQYEDTFHCEFCGRFMEKENVVVRYGSTSEQELIGICSCGNRDFWPVEIWNLGVEDIE